MAATLAIDTPAPTQASAGDDHLLVERAVSDSQAFETLYLPAFRWGYFRGPGMAYGTIDGGSPEHKTTKVADSNGLRFLENGSITLFNLGEETIDLYFFVVEPDPAPATPTP